MEHTLELTDELEIQVDLTGRSGNNIRIAFDETVAITVILNSAYFIRRAADTAFIRTNYP